MSSSLWIIGLVGLGLTLPVSAQRPPQLTVVLPPTTVATPTASSINPPSVSVPSLAPTPSLSPLATPYNRSNSGAPNTTVPDNPQYGTSTAPTNSGNQIPSLPTLPGQPTRIPSQMTVPPTGTATLPTTGGLSR